MNKFLIPTILATVFLVVGIATVSDYGINWDAPFRMMRGQAILHFLLTGQKDYSFKEAVSPVLFRPGEYVSHFNINASEEINRQSKLPERPLLFRQFQNLQKETGQRLSFYESEIWGGHFFVDREGPGHLPLPDLGAAFFNNIFYQKLGILEDIQGYQLFYLLVSSLGVFIVSLFAFEITGSYLAAIVAGVSLGLFPIYFGEAHINMKDPVQAAFFAGAIWSFWHFVMESKLKWYGLFALFVALALGTKWNIMFLPLILVPWLLVICTSEKFRVWFRPIRLFVLAVVFVVAVASFLVLIWPYSWSNPIGRLGQVASYYQSVGGASDPPQQPHGWVGPLKINFYPLALVLTQTPEVILLLTLVAIWSFIRHRGEKQNHGVGILLVAWLIIPFVRQMIPGVWFYSGYRQFMEIVPAFAVLAGLGSFALESVFQKYFQSLNTKILSAVLLFLILANLSFIVFQLHPNENAYFNFFAGGVSGAVKNNLVDWTLTYGNVYKQGVDWLNVNAEKDANLAHLEGNMFAISPLWLRSDISYSSDNFSGPSQKGEYVISLYDPENYAVSSKRYLEKFLNPVYQVKVDGAVLLSVYKNSPENLKSGWKEMETQNFSVKRQNSAWGLFYIVDLGKDYRVTRVDLEIPAVCAAEIIGDDYIFFVPDGMQDQQLTNFDGFVYNERKKLDSNHVEYFFAGEKARFIGLNPQDGLSCLAGGKVTSVSYLTK